MRTESTRNASAVSDANWSPPNAMVPLDAASTIIVQEVCTEFRLTPTQLYSKSRQVRIAFGRMIAMYLCRRVTKASLPRIGDVFYRDHTTVLHAIRRIESTMIKRPMFKKAIRSISERAIGRLVL